MDNLDKYIHGDIEFKDILKIIRNHLCNSRSSFNIEYGAIAFYNFHPKEKETKVRVFPLNENIVDKHFPKDLKIRKKYLEKINQERNYEEFYYYTGFKENYNTTEHFGFTLRSKKDILEHSDTEIEGESWSQYLKGKTKYNILDQLFFEPNNSKFQVIPLPVLYSPATLLVLQKKDGVSSEKIDSVVNKIGESIHFYLFNKLLTEITKDLKPGVIKDKSDLIDKFLVEIAQVAIPIEYKIGEKKATHCFAWFGKEEGKIKTVPLNLAGENVELFMPDFCWHCGEMISDKTEFQIKESEVVKTIENIFGLVYNYWRTIDETKSKGRIVVKNILEETGLNLNILSSVNEELSKIKNAVDKVINITEEQYEESINSVSLNKIVFTRTYDNNGKAKGYTVKINDRIITEKKSLHFGYDILEELNRKLVINSFKDDFSFFEQVRQTIKTRTAQGQEKYDLANKENKFDKSETDNFDEQSDIVIPQEQLVDTFNAFKSILDKEGIAINNLPHIKDFKEAFTAENFSYILTETSYLKKTIDNYKRKREKHNLSIQSKYVNKLHNYFKNEVDVYFQYHMGKKGIDANINPLRGDNQKTDSKSDSRTCQKIENHFFQLCRDLVDKSGEFTDIIKGNFKEANLIYAGKGIRSYQYNKSKISSKYNIEWEFI